jgi:hypothetical protein
VDEVVMDILALASALDFLDLVVPILAAASAEIRVHQAIRVVVVVVVVPHTSALTVLTLL